MWRCKHRAMLKPIATAAMLAASMGGACAQSGPNHDIQDQLTTKFSRSKSISFYFVNRTGKYALTETTLKEKATLTITRSCGNNCASFMAPITNLISKSSRVDCQPGQENVLITSDDDSNLLFSFSGRVLRYNGKCYLNSKGVNAIIQADGFLFN